MYREIFGDQSIEKRVQIFSDVLSRKFIIIIRLFASLLVSLFLDKTVIPRINIPNELIEDQHSFIVMEAQCLWSILKHHDYCLLRDCTYLDLDSLEKTLKRWIKN